MKKITLISLLIFCVTTIHAQQLLYNSLKDLLSDQGITTSKLLIEKRSKKQIALNGGADYRIVAIGNNNISSYLKKSCYAVRSDSSLYINCKQLKYKKLYFGYWYAPAMIIDNNIYFSAMPLGSAVAQSSRSMKVTLGGELGDALASSSLVAKRVYYMIEGTSGHINFVGRQCMLDLLRNYPQLYQEYLADDNESAQTTEKYLRLLSKSEK